MKFLASLILCTVTATAFAVDPSIAGTWDVSTNIAGNDGSSVCAFTEKQGSLSGTCTGDDATAHPITGKIDGAKVTWEYKSDYNGTPLTIKFAGTLDSDKQFKGTVDVDPMGVSGDFTAKRKQ